MPLTKRHVLPIALGLAVVTAAVAAAGVLPASENLKERFLGPAAKKSQDEEPIAFGAPIIIDEDHRAGEPNLRIGPEGRIYVGAPCGFVGCNQGYLWRSVDGGASWQFVYHLDVDGESTHNREWRASVAPGGGDSDIAVTPLGKVYYADLYLAEISVSSSEDGLTWTKSHPAASNVPADDRQWIGVYGEDTVYVIFNQIPYGPMVTKSVDGGLTWTTRPAVPPDFIEEWWTIGNLVVNPQDGRLAFPFAACNDEGECANDIWVSVSDDGGWSWRQFKAHIGTGDVANIFPAMAMDRQGGLYLAWSEENDDATRSVKVAASTDWGESWSAPAVASADVPNAVLPWIAAGDAGRVGVVWYGSNTTGDAETVPTDAEWHLYYAFSDDAFDANATFTTMRPTEKPNHYGPICLGGLGCSGDGGDRSLLDFFQVQVDPEGWPNVIYSDNAELCPPDAARPCPDPYVVFVKQTSGPNLFADEPVAPKPGNGPKSGPNANDAITDAVEWLTSDETRDDVLSGETPTRLAERATEAGAEAAEGVDEVERAIEPPPHDAPAAAADAEREDHALAWWQRLGSLWDTLWPT